MVCLLNKKIRKYNIQLIAFAIILIGCLVRLIGIGKIPNALNIDEASSGYDAFSIMKYGIDRGGNSYPVYLYAWGSGQSALYTYLMIPVVAIAGLSEFSIRLPMAIVGCISLIVFYYLVKNIFDNKKIALVCLGFFTICPWHIMKSRWGLECNLFPDLILLSACFLVLGLKKKKTWLQILAFVCFALSSYTYGTSYLFLPLFILPLLSYLIYKKQLSKKKSIIYLAIMFILCMPIILYVIINTFKLDSINILKITIPRLANNRYESATTIFSGDIIGNCSKNLSDLFKLLIIQNDRLEWNAIYGYGMFYLVSIIFLCIGIWVCKTKYKDNIFNQIMNFWMFAAIILGAVCLININRVNIIVIPCVYYISIGLYEIFEKYKTMIPAIVIIYICLFCSFMNTYWKSDYNEYWTFTAGVKEVAKYCDGSNAQKIYCEYAFKEPFLYFMFYNQENVHEYLDTVEYFEEGRTFDNIKSYGKYKFYLPEEVEEGTIIVVSNKSRIAYELKPVETLYINQFIVYKF